MKRSKITAEKRSVLGKKVKKLRKQGALPVNLYGKKIKSQALQVKTDDFKKVYKEVGETGLVDLQVDKEKETHPVLIHNIQVHPVTGDFLHADLHEVELKEKMKAEIPLVITGKSPAVESKQGVLIQPLNKLEIEALPTDLPEQIEVDISGLKEVDQEIKIKDLKLSSGVSLASGVDENTLVAKIGPLEEEIAEPQPAAEEPAEGEEAAVEGEEGEKKPEGEGEKKEGEKQGEQKPQQEGQPQQQGKPQSDQKPQEQKS